MTQMLAMAVQEYSHAADEPLVDRLENWGRCYIVRSQRNADGTARVKVGSLEGRYRNPWARHWDYHERWGTAPDVRPQLDMLDAEVIHGAWQAIPDAYHQTILGGHYVKRWSPNKCSQVARRTAGMEERKRVSDPEFDAILDMSHRLLERQLAIPAAIRRARLATRVRIALELDVWGAA